MKSANFLDLCFVFSLAWGSCVFALRLNLPVKDSPVIMESLANRYDDMLKGKHADKFNMTAAPEHKVISKSVLLKLDSEPYALQLEPEKWDPLQNITYQWTLVGHDDCYVALSCSKFRLELPTGLLPHPTCFQQYLQVSDGYLGSAKYCGNQGPGKVAPSTGLRDLYVTLQSFPFSTRPELNCSATCVQNVSTLHLRHLPEKHEEIRNSRCLCGQKPFQNRIIGGVEAKRGEHPWIVAMVVAKTRQPYCIGALINDRTVLTGAHCFRGRFRKANNTEVLLNAHRLDPMPNVHLTKEKVVYKIYDDPILGHLDAGNNSYRYQVGKIIMHPLYNASSSDYDTALMILSIPVKYAEYSPICLPPLSKNGAPDLFTSLRGEFVGWGLNHVTATETITNLTKIHVFVLSPETCSARFGDRLPHPKRVLCAAHYLFAEDSCSGDSGGPLAIEEKNVWYQIGISSWSDDCAQVGVPGIYYRTTSTNQWVHYQSNLERAIWCQNVEYPYPPFSTTAA